VKVDHTSDPGNSDQRSISRAARVSGVLYLVIIVCGLYSELAVRGQLVDFTNAVATSTNILNSRGLFLSGFVADSIMLLSDVALAALLYRLLRPVSKTLSLMAAAFRLAQATVLATNLLNHFVPLLLLREGGYAVLLSLNQRQAFALFFLDLHSHAYDLGLLFFAVCNLILGHLVIRSKYIPSLLGYALQMAGSVYGAGSYCRFLLPQYLTTMQPAYIIPLFAESAFCLWLLTSGGKIPTAELRGLAGRS
jgi:hypothetical protein